MPKQITSSMIFLNNKPTNFYWEKVIEDGVETDYLLNLVGERLGLLKDFHLNLENGKWVAIPKRVISE
jgi:hypothetical protein